jgi:hypothetical protein
MKQEETKTKGDYELMIALLSGENYNRLVTEYADELGGMLGVSDYLITMVYQQCINSREYQKAIAYERENKDNRWGYFIETYATCLDWYFLEKCRKLIETEYPQKRGNVETACAILQDAKIDGKTMQDIIELLGMKEQITRQLLLDAQLSFNEAIELLKEKHSIKHVYTV